MTVRGNMTDVVIVGGGPVGLFLASLLLRGGLDVVVLEKQVQRREHSRAVGIHPPSLEAFETVGVAETIVSAGVSIPSGELWSRDRRWASLSFNAVSARYPFVVSLPQNDTEAILERSLGTYPCDIVRRGVTVTDVRDQGRFVTVSARNENGEAQTFVARFVVGADGARSVVRSSANITSNTVNYPDRYLMGDFADTTAHGDVAALYCEADGIVESFPLPGKRRRWVAHTGRNLIDPYPHQLSAIIRERTGIVVSPSSNTMTSSFVPRRGFADAFVRGNIALVGDAAHEMSPIGGQGMNVGWMDALHLASVLCVGHSRPEREELLRRFEARRRSAARAAAHIAWVNMTLGRPTKRTVAFVRNRGLSLAARSPLSAAIAKRFTTVR